MSHDGYYQQQARRAWLLGGVAALGLLTLIIWLVVASLSRPASTNQSSATVVPSSEVSSEETVVDPRVTELSERVKTFETVYHSFDWSNPTLREKELAKYMSTEALEELLKAEHSLPLRQTLIDKKNVRTATIVSEPEGDFIGEDLAEVSVDVEIVSTQTAAEPIRYTITSETQWALSQGVWLVTSVDLTSREEGA